jgi:hypothetical protein
LGGTYVSQLITEDPQKAFRMWIDAIDLKKIGITADPGEIGDIDKNIERCRRQSLNSELF